MMEAASTSETSVNFYQTTRRNIPEDSHLHIRRSEKLKSHDVDIASSRGLKSTNRTTKNNQLFSVTLNLGAEGPWELVSDDETGQQDDRPGVVSVRLHSAVHITHRYGITWFQLIKARVGLQ
jgi:hypothetical protein